MNRIFGLLLGVALLLSLCSVRNTHAQRSITVQALAAPRPEYPYEARRNNITGTGICVATVDPATGLVTHAEMVVSTGSPTLDRAALFAFRRWRFRPGTVSKFQTPITFTMNGAVSFDPNRPYSYTGKVRAVNIPAHYITVQGARGSDIILISNGTKLTKNSAPADLRQVSVGDEVHGFAKVTPERVAVATSAAFKSTAKR